jgi:hypothetical protein
VLVATALAGCQGFDEVPECSTVPAGGCPSSRGGSCDDKTCSAIYACTADGWQLQKVCDRDGGGDESDAEAGSDGPVCGDAVTIDGSLSTCDPNEVLAPDCPLNVAVGCPGSACLSGCLDFFVCRTEGWVEAAYCDDVTGELVWIDGY